MSDRLVPESDDMIEYWWLREDGGREYNFENEKALALLLKKDVVFLNNHWWRDDVPEECKAWPSLNVDVSDVFAWGVADAIEMSFAEINEVYLFWKMDSAWGTAVWGCIKRGSMPQKPVESRIRAAGIWDLDILGLSENSYEKRSRETAA